MSARLRRGVPALLVLALAVMGVTLSDVLPRPTSPLEMSAPTTPSRQTQPAAPVSAARPPRFAGRAPDLRQELAVAESFLLIYQRLSADEATLSARERFFLAFILESCAFGERIPERALEQSRADAATAEGDTARRAQARERVAARNVVRLCEGIVVDADTPARIAALYRRAAEEGDPTAVAWLVQDALESAGQPWNGTDVVAPATPDAVQRQQLLAALESRDPVAIAFAGPLLTRGYDGLGVAFGPDRITPSVGLQRVMWDLAACDHGANCGPRRLQLDHACASANRCSANSYYDYLQRYVLTPQDLSDYARIAPFLQAGIRRGDWSGVHFLERNPLGYLGAGRARPSLGG